MEQYGDGVPAADGVAILLQIGLKSCRVAALYQPHALAIQPLYTGMDGPLQASQEISRSCLH